MRAKRVVGHQLFGNLISKRQIQATTYIDCSKFSLLAREIGIEFGLLFNQCCLFSICLRRDGYVFPCRHRHCPSHQPGHGSEHNTSMGGVC